MSHLLKIVLSQKCEWQNWSLLYSYWLKYMLFMKLMECKKRKLVRNHLHRLWKRLEYTWKQRVCCTSISQWPDNKRKYIFPSEITSPFSFSRLWRNHQTKYRHPPNREDLDSKHRLSPSLGLSVFRPYSSPNRELCHGRKIWGMCWSSLVGIRAWTLLILLYSSL